MKLVIHAPNIHQGGGRALLIALLEATTDVFRAAHLDERLELCCGIRAERLISVRRTVWSRLKVEWALRSFEANDTVLCFGNLPPLFGAAARNYVFLQNRLLVDGSPLGGYPWRVRLRIILERLWLRHRLTKRSILIVQTPSMAQFVSQRLGVSAWVLPFAPSTPSINLENAEPAFDFIYVASGEAHKNHRRLVQAWRLLRDERLLPSLVLTVSEEQAPELTRWIAAQAAEHDLRIVFRRGLVRNQIFDLYRQARCQVYPSLLESYGLPLVEAVACGIPVIASERDFVRDVCVPCQTFDPESALSISRAIKRFLGVSVGHQQPLTAFEFLEELRAGRKL